MRFHLDLVFIGIPVLLFLAWVFGATIRGDALTVFLSLLVMVVYLLITRG